MKALKILYVFLFCMLGTYSAFSQTDQFKEAIGEGPVFYERICLTGRSTNVDNGVDTDLWDRANPTDDDDEWNKPDSAAQYVIASTSALDTVGGKGAQVVTITGLTGWGTGDMVDTAIVDMLGTTSDTIAKYFVHINSIEVTTWGDSTSYNFGKITATPVGGSVAAQINAGAKKSVMAVYGIPDDYELFIDYITGAIVREYNDSNKVELSLAINRDPANQTLFVNEIPFGVTATSGTSLIPFSPSMSIEGPAIVKVQAIGNLPDIEVVANVIGRIREYKQR